MPGAADAIGVLLSAQRELLPLPPVVPAPRVSVHVLSVDVPPPPASPATRSPVPTPTAPAAAAGRRSVLQQPGTGFTFLRYCGFRCAVRTLWHPAPVTAPVVLVGGAFQRMDGWGPLEARLAERTTVVTVDLPGWGGADLLPARYGYSFIAHALRYLLDAAGHRRVHLFGGSYGAAVAFRFARFYPSAAASVALFGAAARLPRPLRARLRRVLGLLQAGRRDRFAAAACDLVLARPAGAQVVRGGAVRRILYRIFRGADRAAAAKFAANTQRLLGGSLYPPGPPLAGPVLLGTGEHDRFTSPHLCREVAQHCLDSRFVLLRGADHAVHLEVPEALSDLLLAFYLSAGR